MSDVWTRARQVAITLRFQLVGEEPKAAPFILAAVLADAGLSIHLLPASDSLLAGAHAVLDRGCDAIWVRQDLPAISRAVLVAHELAHHYLHPEYVASAEYEGATEDETQNGTFLVGYGPRERRETEANVFARELLLPASIARQCFYERGHTATEIADAFDISQSVVYKQLQTVPLLIPTSPESLLPEPLTLDDSQREAATVSRGPLLLGAGPGTGKTRTLVARVQYLLGTGVAPESILCLTFSRKATAELRERMGRYLTPSVARRVAVSTFHSFGLDLLRRYHRAAGLPPRPVLLSQAEAFALMENRIAGDVGEALWFPHEPTYPLRDCLQIIGRLKEEMVSPQIAMERATATNDPKQRAVSQIYARYEETLREKQALDSADLVCRAVQLLTEDAFVREREQERWQHILVDEYQDVNRAGAKLVQLLGGNGSGVWCVGDLRQAIYRFRGASPANVTRFTTDFPGGIRKDLAINYRSRPALVSCFGQMADNNATLWSASRDAVPAAPYITLAVAEDDTAQVAGITREILALRERDPSYRWRDFAILCRTNPQAKAIRTALNRRDVPVVGSPDGMAWLRDETVRELLLLLSLTCPKESALATRVGRTLPPYLAAKTTPGDFLSAALYGPLGLARTGSSTRSVQSLLALSQTFGEQAAVLVGEGDTANAAFLRHVRRVARLHQEPKRDDDDTTDDSMDAVQVLTVHAAKGLEFPVVFVPNLSQGRFPPQARPAVISDADAHILLGGGSPDSDEEARLFFVAMTRARDYLFLSLAEKYEGRAAQPSPLIAPLGAIPEVTPTRWTNVSETLVSSPVQSKSEPETRDSEEDSEGVVPAYELERYLRCPRRYYYETRCGFGDTRERTAYDALKRAVRSSLRQAESESAFNEAWEEFGLPNSDPWQTAYRNEWKAVLENAQAARELSPAMPYRFAMNEGTVEVQADGIAPDGTVERITFAKSKEAGRQDATNTLLFSAVPEGTPVRVRHVRTGEERLIEPAKHANTRRARESHLSHYERALRGIRLHVFPAEPEDAGDCADCAYLLICDGKK